MKIQLHRSERVWRKRYDELMLSHDHLRGQLAETRGDLIRTQCDLMTARREFADLERKQLAGPLTIEVIWPNGRRSQMQGYPS